MRSDVPIGSVRRVLFGGTEGPVGVSAHTVEGRGFGQANRSNAHSPRYALRVAGTWHVAACCVQGLHGGWRGNRDGWGWSTRVPCLPPLATKGPNHSIARAKTAKPCQTICTCWSMT